MARSRAAAIATTHETSGRGTPIRYSIVPLSPEDHLFEVSCTVDAPDPDGQCLALAAWTPGSYMVREYARHVRQIEARAGDAVVGLAKLDKHTWRAQPVAGPLTVTMQVYAWDLSVRGAHLDAGHGFFNGACVFLRVIGQATRPCTVDIRRPEGAAYRHWRVATAMASGGARPNGFGLYKAADHDELIDHPVEMGSFALVRFKAAGVPHEIAITGRHEADLQRLARDMQSICEAQIDFFGRPAPMRRYVFLVMAVGEGYGGLEHRASTALLCARDDLPVRDRPDAEAGYRGFLGLVSHEYFHTWNVKRIRPAAFMPYDLGCENYTSLLWAFEGFTSYYDDLMLVRTGLLTREQYLETLARTITALRRTPARTRQSVAESSFDAWIKYYRQDETAPDAVVSYYGKGSLIALAIDLALRSETAGRRSLDDVMRLLWQRHGQAGIGVPENGIEQAVIEQLDAGARPGAVRRLRRLLDDAVHGTAELPLERLLATVAIDLHWRPAAGAKDRGGYAAAPATSRPLAAGRAVRKAASPERIDIGVRVAGDGDARLVSVLASSAAARAGLSAGDVIMALDGLRVSAASFDARLQRARPGRAMVVHGFRRDELFEASVMPEAAAPDTCDLALAASRDGVAARARARWLHASAAKIRS
jgi:predicted metalloprotease with PDZ domain